MTEEKLSQIKEQVYKDPRPAEHFAKFHERSRTTEPNWIYEAVRIATSLWGWVVFRTRGIDPETRQVIGDSLRTTVGALVERSM